MSFRYPLAVNTWDEAERAAIQKVVNSGRFTMGEKVKEFESSFAQYNGSKYSVMVNSGSSANLLMIASLFYTKNESYKLRHGDEVIVPAVSWSTTYFPLHQYGLHLRFVDIDLNTLNYDLEKLAEAITPNTKLIFAVNLLGNPNDFSRLLQIAGDIPLIEDNCESMGAEVEGKKAGTFGIMGSFSTYFSHHISTMEGGVVCTDDEELYHILLSLRSHGWTRNLPDKNHVRNKDSENLLKESYRFVLPGYNLRPIELSGAIGLEQIKKLPSIVTNRRRNGALLQEYLGAHSEILIQQEVGESSWFGFSLIIRPGSELTREVLEKYLLKCGFEIRPIVAGNFFNNEAVEYFDCSVAGVLANADYIDSHGLYIGNQSESMESAFKLISEIR